MVEFPTKVSTELFLSFLPPHFKQSATDEVELLLLKLPLDELYGIEGSLLSEFEDTSLSRSASREGIFLEVLLVLLAVTLSCFFIAALRCLASLTVLCRGLGEGERARLDLSV